MEILLTQMMLLQGELLERMAASFGVGVTDEYLDNMRLIRQHLSNLQAEGFPRLIPAGDDVNHGQIIPAPADTKVKSIPVDDSTEPATVGPVTSNPLPANSVAPESSD